MTAMHCVLLSSGLWQGYLLNSPSLQELEWTDGKKKASSSSDLVRKRGRDVLLVVLITEEQAQRGERFVQSCCSSPGKHLRLH